MRVAFKSLGCKVNQYEAQVMKGLFLQSGFDIVDSGDIGDVYVINSCTVTETGEKKSLKIIRQFRKQNPNAIVVLTGCFPQAFPDVAKRLKEVDIIMGSSNRKGVVDAVKKHLLTGKRIVDITPHIKGEKFEKMSADNFFERTRAFVKIQDGCERYCSYCIIPKARGFVRSKGVEDIKSEIKSLSDKGFKEVVLVGINLSSYGKDIGLKLIDAVEVACQIEGIERIRLGSLEPELLDIDTLKKMKTFDKFCPQFHLSLQSGCDKTLKLMRRQYTSEEYLKIVADIFSVFDNPAITTDMMVGFPDESDIDFVQSVEFAKKVGFAKVHVFAYSKRAGTKAATFENQIDNQTKEYRSRTMINECSKLSKQFLTTQVNKNCDVLFETKDKDGFYCGHTKNYTLVKVKSDDDLCGKILEVKLNEVSEKDLTIIGEVVK